MDDTKHWLFEPPHFRARSSSDLRALNGFLGARTNGIQPLDRISEEHVEVGAEALSSVISLSLTKLLLVDLVFGAKSGLTARRAPAQQHPGRTGIDHAVFRDATFGGAVAADVLPLELSRCVCVGID
jgi:hypothetical protein